MRRGYSERSAAAAADPAPKNYGIPVVEWLLVPLAAHDPEWALANVPRQDANCGGLMGVNVYGCPTGFMVARGTRGV